MIKHISELSSDIDEQIEKNQSLEYGQISGIPTGFKEFDKFSHGLQPTDLIVVGAETSQGKTAFCVDVTFNAALKGYSSLFVTLEMSGLQLASRVLSKNSGISSKDLLMRKLKGYEIEGVKGAMEGVKDLPVYIEDEIDSNFKSLFTRIHAHVKEYGLQLVVIDYLQLISNKSSANTSDKFAEVANYSKRFAKAMGIPVVLVSQLKRVEPGKNPKPTRNRLKQSGDIENAADTILLLWRPESYDIPEVNIGGLTYDSKGRAHLIVDKGRNIGTASFLLKFNASTTTFSDDEEAKEDEDDQIEVPF